MDNMQNALVAAEVSMSMADVDMTAIGQKRTRQRSCLGFLIQYFAFVLACGSLFFSIASIVIERATIVYVAMGIAIAVAPVVLVQRSILVKHDGLRIIHNAIRLEVNELSNVNNELAFKNDRLREKVSRLEQAQEGLETIVTKQGGHVDQFVDLVRENGKIQKEIKTLLIDEALASIITVVLISDRDGDFQIDPEEIDALIFRLKNSRGIEDLNEDRFRRMLTTEGHSLETVLDIAKNLMEEEDEEKQVVKVSSRGLHLGQ